MFVVECMLGVVLIHLLPGKLLCMIYLLKTARRSFFKSCLLALCVITWSISGSQALKIPWEKPRILENAHFTKTNVLYFVVMKGFMKNMDEHLKVE